MAVAPSSVASTVDRPPPSLPMGVRAVPRITVLSMPSRLASPGFASPDPQSHRPLDHLAATSSRLRGGHEDASGLARQETAPLKRYGSAATPRRGRSRHSSGKAVPQGYHGV